MEQQDVMTRLGSSAEGSRVRVLMQCASLHSDMEAFKVRTICVMGGASVLGVSGATENYTKESINN